MSSSSSQTGIASSGKFAGASHKVWEDVSTTFTEFGALSSEKKQSGGFFSRLLKRNKDDDSTGANNSQTGAGAIPDSPKKTQDGNDDQTDTTEASNSSDSPSTDPSTPKRTQSFESATEDSTDGAVPHRNLSSVLSRLSSILDHRSTTPQTYKDSDFKQYWMPDRSCRECYDCGDKFTTFRRRHHCRICGQIFCSKCCNQELPGKIIGYKGGIRVCTYCCRVVQRYAQTSSSTGDMRALEDLRAMSQQIYESGSFEFGVQSVTPRVADDMSPQFRYCDVSAKVQMYYKDQQCYMRLRSDDTQNTIGGKQKAAQDTVELYYEYGEICRKLSHQNSLETLPELSGLTTPDLSMPFDLTPQTEFSTEESLLRESKLLIQDSVQLRQLWRQVFDSEMGVETQTLRIRLRTHQNCIVGKELVDWLIKNDKAATRVQAIGIGQALLYAGYMECVGNQPPIFKDNFTLYRPGEMASVIDQQGEPEQTPTITEEDEKTEPLWLKEIEREEDEDEDDDLLSEDTSVMVSESDCQQSGSSQSETRRLYYLNDTSQSGSFSELPKLTLMSRDLTEEPLPRQDPSVHGLGDDFLKGALFLGKAPMPSSDVVTCPHGWRIVEQLREENGEKLAYTRLKKAHSEHWQSLIRQMLSQNGLLLSWESVIASCITQVSHFVRPDIRLEGDDMDIRNYVHIKKVPGGLKSDTNLTHGVIFTKNIAHKKMKTKITNPLILLLRGTIEFQRVEQKFSSLEPQILQEREFMRNCVMKMIAYRPNVIVVEKSVSRLAQEFLLQCGITLLYNVKLSVMERLARFTQADIVPSIDGLVSKPNMGFCHDFRCQTYILPNKEIKTLAVFDGCATHLGCTIVLSGGSASELRRVKQILKFMIYTAYNSLLELCFCMDEFALPQPMGDELTQSFHAGSVSPDPSLCNRSIGNDELSNLAPRADEHGDTSDKIHHQLGEHQNSKGDNNTATTGDNDSSASHEKSSKINPVTSMSTSASTSASIFSTTATATTATTASDTPTVVDNNSLSTVTSKSIPPTIATTTSTPTLLTTSAMKIRHFSGLSSSSGGLSREDMSGRSSPEIFIDQENMMWDGNAKVIAGILCVIPKTELDPPFKPRVRSSNSDSQKQDGAYNSSDFEESSEFIDALDYTVVDVAECESMVEGSQHQSGNDNSNINSENVEKETLSVPLFKKREKTSSSSNQLTVTELTDFSDPLLGYQNTKDESIFNSENHGKISLKEIKQSNYKRFRKALDGVHLSISPYHKYSVPFIETNKGLQCNSRKYLPENIFWSRLFDGEWDQKMHSSKTKGSESDMVAKPENIEILTSHKFLTCDLTQPIWDTDMQTILADFRARGGRIRVLSDRNGGTHHQLTATHDDSSSTTTGGGGGRDKEETGGQDGMMVDNNNLVWEKKIDCLDSMNHQRLMVLFSSFSFKSSNHPHPCVYPWVVTMDFYGRNDITLGGFLERFCFRKQYLCPSPSCDIPMTEHIRRFVHGNACINVLLKKLDNEVPGGKENILMWSWCRKCKQVTPVVPISADTWSLSFAKYLDLRFHSSTFLRRASAEPCPHSLHHEHFQYFGHRDIVASFKYSSISLKELALPSPAMVIKAPVFDSTGLLNNVRRIMHRATERYSQIWESTMKLKQEMTSETQTRVISEFFHDQQHDKTRFRDAATNVQMKIQDLVNKVCANQSKPHAELDYSFQLFAILDNIALLKRIISEDVIRWNGRLQEFVTHQQKRSRTQLRKEKDLGPLEETALEKSTKVASAGKNITSTIPTTSTTSIAYASTTATTTTSSGASVSPTVTVAPTTFDPASLLSLVSSTSSLSSTTSSSVFANAAASNSLIPKGASVELRSSPFTGPQLESSSESVHIGDGSSNATSNCHTTAQIPSMKITNSTDVINTALQPTASTTTTTNATIIATSTVTPAAATTATTTAATTATTTAATTATTTAATTATTTAAAAPEVEVPVVPEVVNGATPPPPPPPPSSSQQPQSSSTSQPQTTNEVEDTADGWLQDLKGVTRRWLSNSSFTPLALPFELNEHHTLPMCEKVPIAVYDNEPSSIIAYALSSSDYLCRLREVQLSARCSNNDGANQSAQSGKQTSKQEGGKSSTGGAEEKQETGRKTKVLSFLRGNMSNTSSKDTTSANLQASISSQSTASSVTVDSVRYIPTPDKEDVGGLHDELNNSSFLEDDTPSPDDKTKVSGNNAPSPHIQLQFSNFSSKFYCRIYFADHFRKLRKLILPGNEMTFIRSLSRCKAWEAKGGKSGSAFSKTDDDRFILKQMSSNELDSFEKFGPQYFTYIKNCLAEQQPTALAKILGVFRIGFSNSQTNNALRQNLLVMENLFYDKKIFQKFDLKGSIRNRMVSTSGRQAEEELVLLDENLLKTSVESPLYLRPHNKHVLKSAITSDTVFLSSNLVMDYSLLVGIVEDTDELVVGIIDYIRTFTWDKKLEMAFKSSGILGGQGKMPTVVSPQLYRGRFLEAMDRYFLHVPDRWTGLGVDYPMKQTNQDSSDQAIL